MRREIKFSGLALIVSLIMFLLTMSDAFNELRKNVFGVIFTFIVMGVIGYFYSKLFEGEEHDKQK